MTWLRSEQFFVFLNNFFSFEFIWMWTHLWMSTKFADIFCTTVPDQIHGLTKTSVIYQKRSRNGVKNIVNQLWVVRIWFRSICYKGKNSNSSTFIYISFVIVVFVVFAIQKWKRKKNGKSSSFSKWERLDRSDFLNSFAQHWWQHCQRRRSNDCLKYD